MAGSNGLHFFPPQREKSLRARLSDNERLNINDISQSCDDIDPKYIKGTIVSQELPVHSDTVGKQVEFMITDESLPDGKSIKLRLVGSIANDFPSETIGNVIYIINCSIVENTNITPHCHKFQLSCNSNIHSPLVWLFRKTSDAEKQGPSTKKAKDSAYPLIAHLKEGTTVNLYGVVKAFKDARKSQGEDYYTNVLLVDESGEEISCNLFSSNPSLLPKITSVGDILRLHRLKVKSHGGCKQGVGVQKWGCSSVVFDGNCVAEITPRPSSASFQFTDYDKNRVSELRQWAAQQDELHGCCIQLSGIARDLRFDLICQVVSIGIDKDNLRAYLSVWDGTKANMNVRTPDKTKEVQEKMSVDNELEASAGDLVVNVTLYDDHIEHLQNIKCRDFIRLQNLHAASYSDDGVDLCIHRQQGGKGLFKYSSTDLDVLNLKKVLDGIIQKQRHPLTSETLHPDVPFSTIAQMNNFKVPHKHHLKVQVTQVLPPDIIKMVKLYCPQCKSRYDMSRGDSSDITRDIHDAEDECPLCTNKSSPTKEASCKLKYAFRMRLRLEDYTGVINAYLVEEDAAVMFPDLPATNLFLDHASRDALCKKLSYLCGGTNPFDTPIASMKPYSRPWLDCCVKSYYIGGKPKNPTDKPQVAYRIFDTILNSS